MKKLMNEQCNYFCLRKSMIYLIFMKDIAGLLIARCLHTTLMVDKADIFSPFSWFHWTHFEIKKKKKIKISTFPKVGVTTFAVEKRFSGAFWKPYLSFNIL